MIAADTVDTSLRRIGEDIFGEHCLTDFFGDIVFAREGLTRRFVFYEFDPEKKAEATDFTDVRVRFELRQISAREK